jgi:hypothetical protein
MIVVIRENHAMRGYGGKGRRSQVFTEHRPDGLQGKEVIALDFPIRKP